MALENNSITAPKGFLAGAIACGIKASGKPDLAILASRVPAAGAAVFTTNKVVGAPVLVGREQIKAGRLGACIINSGCANVCTGKRGIKDAREMCAIASTALATTGIGHPAADILPFSTGVIGHYLPMEKIRSGAPKLMATFGDSPDHGNAFAQGILTTDLVAKSAIFRLKLSGKTVTIAGCCKGSGMIAPNMATMLAFVATDANIPAGLLRRLLRTVTAETFNCVTVDQHTSTSDTFACMANGLAENPAIKANSQNFAAFQRGLLIVCDSLSRQIARDGEGATKLVTVRITGAASPADAHRAAMAIANSPLAKTAIHGGDPNWGRFVSAAGYSGAAMNPDRASCRVGGILVFRKGQPAVKSLAEVEARMKQPEIEILVDLGTGKSAHARVYTCDLSREYITINADYHT